MQSCYAPNATFNDEVFLNLDFDNVCGMWEMFCVRGGDIKIDFKDVSANQHEGKARWTATYVFSATGHKVVNEINANFVFENGKIIQHNDHFNFYKWSKQAFGIIGLLFGWTNFFKKKVQSKAIINLKKFIEKRKS